jgi:hypothetical protein
MENIGELEAMYNPDLADCDCKYGQCFKCYIRNEMRSDKHTAMECADAFWVTPDNVVIPVDGEHYDFANQEVWEEWERDNICTDNMSFWREGMTKDAMLTLFSKGWIRLRKYHHSTYDKEHDVHTAEPRWDIHGENIWRKRGKLRWIANFLLENLLVKDDHNVTILTEEESYWGTDPNFAVNNMTQGEVVPITNLL